MGFMRKTLIAGNWKMNKTLSETERLLQELVRRLAELRNEEVAEHEGLLGRIRSAFR